MGTTSPGALAGIKVLDFTHILSGPYCTMILGDLGADIIKIERISGDETRGSSLRVNDYSVQFGIVNRNKRSIAIDLSTERGVALACSLAERVDVVVENFRPGALDGLGLGAKELRELNPRLVYCSISGFGTEGPGRNLGGFDIVAQGESGVLSITGSRSGEIVKVGVPIADLSSGIYSALAIASALYRREQTGRGDVVNVALLDSVMSLLVWEAAESWTLGRVPRPVGTAHRNRAPYQVFEAADGPFVVGAGNQATWEALCRALERPDLASDPRFAGNADRVAHEDELVDALSAVFADKPAAEWLAALAEAGCPAGRVLNVAEAFESDYAKAQSMKIEMDNPEGGILHGIGFPYKLAESQARVHRRPPQLGEHTREILRELLDLSADDVEHLVAEGVVA